MFGHKRKFDDFTSEIEAHIQLEIERLRGQGMSEEEAQAAARRSFGNRMQAEERFYESGHWLWWDHFWHDVRYALRMLRKSPGFTVVAVLTLALGIGATTMIFSAVYAVLLKPLPFKNADRLVFIRKKNPPRGWIRNPISPTEILAWRKESGVFEDLAAFTRSSCVLTGSGEAEEDPCEIASSNLFQLLGVTPLRGRTFSADEDKPEGPRVAILSYGLWQRRFGAAENVIGRAIALNGTSYTVVGVMPANFSHLYASPYTTVPEIWVAGIALSQLHAWNDYFGVGQLKPAISLQQAESQMDTVSGRLEQEDAGLKGWRAELMTLRMAVSGDTRPALVVLMGAVVFVLLIACANIANLLLARGASRANEFAIRSAMGARQGRLVCQLLTEGLVISLAGGVFGVSLASWGGKGLVVLAPPFLLKSAPGLARGTQDLRVLAFALLTVLMTTFLFALAPALQSARPHLTETLKETGRSSAQSPRSRRFRSALVVSEIALAMVLLVGAGLMVRTLAQLSSVNLGLNPSCVLTLRVPLFGDRYKHPESQVEFWEHVLAAVKALPGVEAASVSRGLPVNDWSGQFFTTSEQPNPPPGQVPDANYVIASPDYFRALQIPLRTGRSFNERDTQGAERVVIVNEALARSYWPGQDPLGKQLRVGSPGSTAPWLSVVGVAGNVLSQGPDAGFHPEIYIPYQQFPWLLGGPQHLLVRTSAKVRPEALARAVVQEVHRVDKDQPAADIATLEQVAQEPMTQQRMVMALLVSFAALALFLSALGIYSVLSYSIAQRTREIGVRVALGAEPGAVLRLVVGGGARLALLGISVGMAAAFALTRLMTDLLFGVRPTDPVTFCVVAIVLAITSLLACYIPARRAVRVDPLVALRYE
jgi:putative ABC transport system permease protein